MDGKLRRATWIMVILAVAVLGGGAASSSAPASLGDDQMRAVRGTAVNCWQCLHKACPNGHPEECARRQFAGVMYCNQRFVLQVAYCEDQKPSGYMSCKKYYESGKTPCSRDWFWADKTPCKCDGTALFYIDNDVNWTLVCEVGDECPPAP